MTWRRRQIAARRRQTKNPVLRFSVRSLTRASHCNLRYFLLLGLLLVAFPFLAAAQEAAIVGTVTDPSGGVVPKVAITITSVDTGRVRAVMTNDDGQFAAPGLPIGRYDLKAEASGFKVEETKGVILSVNDRIR